jgi:4-amino-4-deoxy-L-arabinose transferase-like glycosyltransferase
MPARILSIATPLFVYITLAVLAVGLWEERRKFDRTALALALAGVLASLMLLDPVHRLFFDEDIYINIASNLTKAPVAQFTLVGGPEEIAVSTYYKEPAGWPVLLSNLFFLTGPSEQAAFALARIFYGLTLAAVYILAFALLRNRVQAVLAAVLVGATPAVFWFSASAGTDLPAVFFTILGLCGIYAGNGALAASGIAMAAQFRLELIVLTPLVWLAPQISNRWKAATAGLVAAEAGHVAWVLSLASEYARAVRVDSAFSLGYIPQNVAANVRYLLNPLVFPSAIMLLAAASLFRKRSMWPRWPLLVAAASVFGVYAVFYVGSFEINPRYSIHVAVPLAVLAASVLRRPVFLAAVVASLVVPQFNGYFVPQVIRGLEMDHRIAVENSRRVGPDDLVLGTQHEVFLNQGRRAMNAILASEQPARLNEFLEQKRKVWYYAGIRTTTVNSQDWDADQWVKSNYELHPIDTQEAEGIPVVFYELLFNRLDREAR